MAKVDIDVNITSRERVKPSSPTPLHLKTFNLSSFDQAYPTHLYTSYLIFYPFLDHYDHHQDRHVHELKSSLSKTLTLFYPLAGRMSENEPFIDCTDEGAYFFEANVSGNLSDILKRPDPEVLSRLLPTKIVSVQDAAASGVLLLVQTNLFDCGGLAIGFSIAHKVADACTVNLFIKGWAAQARGAGDAIAPDMTAIASRFPVVSGISMPHSSVMSSLKTKSFKTRRFVFDSKSINALKMKATSASLQRRPSRVEVVSGHIWLSIMKLSVWNSTKKISHVLCQPINLRQRLDPPLSKNSFGNFVECSFALAREITDDKLPDLDGLIGEIRIAFQRAIESYAKKNAGQETFLENYERKERMRLFPKEDGEMVTLMITSTCRLGFHKNSDFGWGEPIWFTNSGFQNKSNSVTLLDTEDGDGIQVWVTLEEHVLDLLETDQDFLEFASVNPSINLC